MTDIDTLIVRTLATTDALLLPIRRWETHLPANRQAGLAMLESHGVPLRVGGDDQTRKTGERTIAEAVEQGLIAVSRQGREKFPYLKLTLSGMVRARALAFNDDNLNFWTVADLFVWRLRKYSRYRQPSADGLRYIAEILLNDGEGWGDGKQWQLANIELDYVCAAALGWATCISGINRQVNYAITPEGEKQLNHPGTTPDCSTLPKPSLAAEKVYIEARDAKLSEIATAEQTRVGEVGPLPAIGCLLSPNAQEIAAFCPHLKVPG